MRNTKTLIATLSDLCMVRHVDTVPKGHVRIQTGFLYPDGSSVDVFLVDDDETQLLDPTKLSDFGQTTAFLLDHEIVPWTSKKRRAQLDDALELYDVKQEGGALVRHIDTRKESLQEGIILLGQSCIRMSDLLYTKRLQLQSPFNDDVEEFIADTGLPFEAGVQLPGQFGPVSVDFLVSGKATQSAVLTLFSRLAAPAHTQANEVFKKWHDLNAFGGSENRITLLDDNVDVSRVYRDDDLRRLQQYSTVQPFSDRGTLAALLAA